MKNLSKTGKYTVTAIVVTVFAMLYVAYARSKSGFELGSNHAIIYPQAHWGGKDCDELGRILQQYDKSLYKIQTFENGNLVRTAGELDESVMRRGLVSEVTKEAQEMKFTGCAIQANNMPAEPAGSRTPKPRPSPSASPSPSVAPSPSPGASTTMQTLVPRVAELAKRVQPVLDKYNKK